MKVLSSRRVIISLAILSALAYNAWLLGFWLNPTIVKVSLLSSLQALNQPYHYLFIGTDILSGLLAFLFAALLYKLKSKEVSSSLLYLKVILGGIAGFAVCTIAAALIPMPKPPEEEIKTGLFGSFSEFIHDGISVTALICTVLAFIAAAKLFKQLYFKLIAVAYIITVLWSFAKGIWPEAIGPLGQWINTALIGIWLISVALILSKDCGRQQEFL